MVDFPDLTLIDNPLSQGNSWDGSIVETNHMFHARLLHRLKHNLGVFQTIGQGFLAEHILPNLSSNNSYLLVKVSRNGDIHQVYIISLHQLLPGGLITLPPIPGGGGLHCLLTPATNYLHHRHRLDIGVKHRYFLIGTAVSLAHK